MNSLVSVIIPIYNRAHIISDTLNSVLSQTYQNWECIVVDDGSTDTTVEILEAYAKRDNRFVIKERSANKKKGASSCRNIGLENAKGVYIQFLDSDDLLSKDKLAKQLQVLEKAYHLSFAFCKWGRFVNSYQDAILYEDFEVYKDFDSAIQLLNSLIISKGYLPLHSFLFPKELINKAGLWDENLCLNDDGEFMSRVTVNFEKAIFTSDCFVLYRFPENEASLSSFANEEKVLSAIASWETIFKLYKINFKGEEKKYKKYIKKGVYLNAIKFTPELLNHTFFSGLKIRFFKERVFWFLSKKINQIFR